MDKSKAFENKSGLKFPQLIDLKIRYIVDNLI